jgi:predicted amino acid dehydrogenase
VLRMRPQRLRKQCFIGDEGWPLEVGLQEQASNHLKLRGSRVRVVSVEEKAEANSVRCVLVRRTQVNH